MRGTILGGFWNAAGRRGRRCPPRSPSAPRSRATTRRKRGAAPPARRPPRCAGVPAACPATAFRAAADPAADQLALELRDAGEDAEHQPTGWREVSTPSCRLTKSPSARNPPARSPNGAGCGRIGRSGSTPRRPPCACGSPPEPIQFGSPLAAPLTPSSTYSPTSCHPRRAMYSRSSQLHLGVLTVQRAHSGVQCDSHAYLRGGLGGAQRSC